MTEIQEAIMESCEAAGLQFDYFDDILEYFYKEDKKIFNLIRDCYKFYFATIPYFL